MLYNCFFHLFFGWDYFFPAGWGGGVVGVVCGGKVTMDMRIYAFPKDKWLVVLWQKLLLAAWYDYMQLFLHEQ